MTDRVPAAVRDGSQSFNKLGDRQRDCRPLSELGRAVRSPVAPEPPSGETDYQTEDHMKDRVPSSDIHIERRAESGSKDKTQDHPPNRTRACRLGGAGSTALFGTAESCHLPMRGRWLPATRRYGAASAPLEDGVMGTRLCPPANSDSCN